MMDDLSSVEWTAPKIAPASKRYPQTSGNYYPTLRPTPPISGRTSPSHPQQIPKPLGDATTKSGSSSPANDSFANLVNFTASQSTKGLLGLSLQQQQRKISEEKAKQETERNRAFDQHFGSIGPASIISNGSITPGRIASPSIHNGNGERGSSKPSQIATKPSKGNLVPTSLTDNTVPVEHHNDLLAAFNSSAPVSRASHMPEPSKFSINGDSVGKDTGLTPSSSSQVINGVGGGYTEDPDDDPFGLGTNTTKSSSGNNLVTNGLATDDDILGLLGRPISEFAKKPEIKIAAPEPANDTGRHPQDRAIAELVDMGFSAQNSKSALGQTASGTDVQAAVGWLLNEAHEESRNQKRPSVRNNGGGSSTRTSHARRDPGRRRSSGSAGAKPAWMREHDKPTTVPNRAESKSPANGEKDPAQYATELGNKMFKTAGSLWKTSTKKINQAVQDFNSDSDSSQPKWMRDTGHEQADRKSKSQQRGSDVHDHDRMGGKQPQNSQLTIQSDTNVTDEALMLEADSRLAPRKPRTNVDSLPTGTNNQRQSAHTVSPGSGSGRLGAPQPKFMQNKPTKSTQARMTRQAVEEESSLAYISPARRKRPAPIPAQAEPEPDLILDVSKTPSQPPIFESVTPHPNSSRPSPDPLHPKIPAAPLKKAPSPPKREIPTLSRFALHTSAKGRLEGNSAFKRGDYAQATAHYSSSLSAVPNTHPVAIVLLTNRALSQSKTGDAKASLADAKSALDLIGLSKGIGETIEMGNDDKAKPMSTYWEKAMMRQAEALEHLERWSDAAVIWRTCVEAGVGGATSSAGRIRCEKAAAPPSQSRASSAPKKAPPKARPKPTALGDLVPDSESVTRLRVANAAADRLDDEKFALADVVDQRVSRWRAGKEGNLRALLATLENVLWEGSEWKKVGMGDVLLPGKVKIIYMKGIAKVHPDKVEFINLEFVNWSY